MYSEKLLMRKVQVESQILRLHGQLDKVPKGYLCFERNGTYVKWYYCHDGIREYIPKKQKKLAERLAIQEYRKVQLAELENELNAIETYIECKRKSPCSENMLCENSLYRPLLETHFVQHDEEIVQWLSEPYNRNMSHSENLIHKSVAGIMVRSKSEALIVSALVKNNIPFRYECPLYLNDHVLYPDFTVLHPKTKKIYYWEHFGKMDEDGYIKTTNMKINTYFSNGINPANNLIMTFETAYNPLDYEIVETTIQMYFG